MVYIKNATVETLRVNAGTGSLIGGDTDLLQNIKDAIRADGDGGQTVIHAIREQTSMRFTLCSLYACGSLPLERKITWGFLIVTELRKIIKH